MSTTAPPHSAREDLLACRDLPSMPPPALDAAPFWEQPWIAPALRAVLFDNLTAAERVFFLADATLWRQAMDGKEIEAAGLPSYCLTDLVTSEDLSRAGPHLLDITLAPEADPSNAHRWICGRLQEQGVGIFLRAVMPLGSLATHLARMVLMPVEDSPKAERRYFRFWDPAVLATYLAGNADDPQALGWLFQSALAAQPLQIVGRYAPGVARHWTLAHPARVPLPKEIPTLRPRDIALFDRERQCKVCNNAINWIRKTYGDKDVEQATLVDAALRQVAPLAKIGITSEYALRYVLAGFYLSGRSLRNLDEADQSILHDPTTPQDKRAAHFLRAVQARTGVTPIAQGGGNA